MLWFSFKTVFSHFNDDMRDSEVSSHTVAEEKEIVRSWNQEVHSQIIVTYLMNLKSDYFEIIFWTWMKTRAARLQINLRCSRKKE